MLDDAEVFDAVRHLWSKWRLEIPEHDRVYDYLRGKRGAAEVPEGAGRELEDIAKEAVKNVLTLVRDAFAQNLSVIGLRSPDESENASAWALWQRFKLDARQSAIHRPAVSYGASYAIGLKDEVRLRTPRQMFAVYEDPQTDEWPALALEVWTDHSGPKPARVGRLYDEEFIYPLVVIGMSGVGVRVVEVGEPIPHGADYCPVVRYVNDRDAEDVIVGEIAPLIPQQRAINAVNFDRLVVSRYGAFPQKYTIGWQPSRDELIKASVARLAAFHDHPDDMQVGSWPAASVEPYNSILGEMLGHVAMTAQIPPSLLTGSLTNLSAEAIAMAEAPHQRKLKEKRRSLGESHEQLLRHLASLHDVEIADDAEVIWDETEARSFAQVVDGIVKLGTAGVPIEELVADVPGWTQQRMTQVRAAIRRAAGRGVLDALRGASGDAPVGEPTADAAGDFKAKSDALGALIRAGATPESAAQMVGLAGLKFTGAVPVSLRLPESEAADLEEA